jgi:uncharacterized membrane protein
MPKNRLEAFSDGVLAIIITIMVLDLRPPQGAAWPDLLPDASVFTIYVLSFLYVGIYWNNHHHMLHAAERVNGAVLWANLHLLFWLSLIPFATAWMGQTRFAAAPTALYGINLLMAAAAYWILQRAIIAAQGESSLLSEAIGHDFKGKISPAIYLAAILTSFVAPKIACALYVLAALMWLIPDRRIERRIEREDSASSPSPDAEAPEGAGPRSRI